MMKEVNIDTARKAHENGLAILLLGDTWNEKDEISVEIGGELILPTDDFTEHLIGYDFLSCGEHERVRCFLL